MGYCFNQSVNNLLPKLTDLTFGHCFNELINLLPNTITHLTFGYLFNKSVNSLPNTITHLTFGHEFIRSVNSLPITIKEIGFYAHNKIKNNIPDSVEYVNIYFSSYTKYNERIENISPNIKVIKINNSNKAHYFKKILFGCKVIDVFGNIILD